jgi:hypothetical protein
MLHFMYPPRLRGAYVGALLALCGVPTAVAQGEAPSGRQTQATAASDAPVTGRGLFEQGKALFEADRLDEACAKFAQSHRVEPNTAALLALATCHRDQGKYASAWEEFTEGERRACLEVDPRQQRYARIALQELSPRLSTLQVDVAPPVAAIPGLALSIDGTLLPALSWNSKIPLDGGLHTLEATAPGRKPWRQGFYVESEANSVRLTAESLEVQPAPALPGSGERDLGLRQPENTWSTVQWAGVAAVGVGAVGLIVGATGLAIKNPEWGVPCGAAGLVAVGTGITLFWLGGAPATSDRTGPQVAMSIDMPTPRSAGFTMYGAF